MVRTLACFAMLAALSLVSVNAQALFIFGSRKFEMRCLLSNEPPRVGAFGRELPAPIVSIQGSAKTSGRIDLVSNNKVLIPGMLADIRLTQAQSGVFTLAVRFVKPTGQVLHQEKTTLKAGQWAGITYRGRGRDLSYLNARCMIQRSR